MNTSPEKEARIYEPIPDRICISKELAAHICFSASGKAIGEISRPPFVQDIEYIRADIMEAKIKEALQKLIDDGFINDHAIFQSLGVQL